MDTVVKIPNIELLDKALKIIEEHPEHWDQTVWHCGTSHCLAGHIYLMIHKFPYDCGSMDDVEIIHNTFWEAKKALNISEDDADVLFDGDNTLEDLKRMRDKLASCGTLHTIESTENL